MSLDDVEPYSEEELERIYKSLPVADLPCASCGMKSSEIREYRTIKAKLTKLQEDMQRVLDDSYFYETGTNKSGSYNDHLIVDYNALEEALEQSRE